MTLIIGILLGGAVVIFALQNVATVMVTFLGYQFQGSLALIVILSILAGILISLLFSLSAFIQGMMSESRLKRHNNTLQRELDDHKVLLDEANKKLADTPAVVVVETSERI
jgi:uncharacterized integral membrane protein